MVDVKIDCIIHMVMWSDMLKGHIFKEQWNWESMHVYILSQCIVHVVAFIRWWKSYGMALRQCESYFIVALFYSDGQRICIQEYICLCGTVWTWRLQGKICVLKSNCGQILASLSLSDSYFEDVFSVLLTKFCWHGRNIPDFHVHGLRICCCHPLS